MTEQEKNKIALFRYGIISPLASDIFEGNSKKDFFREAAKKTYKNNLGKEVKVSAATIERWFYTYKREGYDGLLPQGRSDVGSFRKMDEDVCSQIRYLKKEYPRIPATLIYEKLIQTGVVEGKSLSLSSVNRYVKSLNQENNHTSNKDMRRYEREHINEVWCGDSSVGPYLQIGNKKMRTYIIALIDDASRFIVGIDIFLNDNYINLMSVMKSAVQKYGKPKTLNFDNGSSYKNGQMTLLAARAGMTLNYCQPYTPVAKAKIERWFRTMKDHWMAQLRMSEFKKLEELRESLLKYVNQYNQSPHSSLDGETPKDRFFRESSLILRMSETQIEQSFLLEIERRVSSDNVIVIENKEYEVHYRYAKRKLRLRYSPDLTMIYIVLDNGELEEIKLLDKQVNSQIRRERVKLTGGEEE